jgi:hypothetical protein
VKIVFLQNFGAGDVGRHEIGRELHAREMQSQQPRDNPNQQRFRQPRHANQQTMSAAQQRDDDGLDRLVLADDDLRNIVLQILQDGRKLVEVHDGVLAGDRREWRQRGHKKFVVCLSIRVFGS